MDSCLRPRGNLTPRTRDQRLRAGVAVFTLSLIIGVITVKAGVAPIFRLGLIVPFWFAAQSFVSALHGT